MSFVLFFVLAALMVVSAIGVVVARHPVRATLSLVVTLFLLAVFFVFLDADFVAALQVVVYAGAIMVVFLFVLMLLNLQHDEPVPRPQLRTSVGLAGASLSALILLYFLPTVGPL